MSEPKYAHRFPPCPVYDIEGLESWLEDLAKQGLVLTKAGLFFGFAEFEKTAPKSMRYRLQPLPKKKFLEDRGPADVAMELAEAYEQRRLEAEAAEQERRRLEAVAAEQKRFAEEEQHRELIYLKQYQRAAKSQDIQTLLDATRILQELGNYRNSQELARQCTEKADRLVEEQKKREIRGPWRRSGCCQYCGGQLKGLFTKKCTQCGKAKDY